MVYDKIPRHIPIRIQMDKLIGKPVMILNGNKKSEDKVLAVFSGRRAVVIFLDMLMDTFGQDGWDENWEAVGKQWLDMAKQEGEPEW